MQRPTHFVAAAGIALAASITLACSDSSAPLPPPPTGVIEVTISTTGASADIDPDGYFISLDGRAVQPINVNGVMNFEALGNGTHRVDLSGLTPKCVLEGPSERSVDIAAQTGAASRLMVLFSVSCKAEAPGPDPWDY
jgi:hypothetical protein